MSERSKTIFLPEAGQPVIDAITAHHDTGLEVRSGVMPLLNENGVPGALERLKSGEFAAVIVGAKYSSADVIRAGLDVIGAEDGLISSFFAMETDESADDESKIFLADCAVVPAPDKDTLVKITEQTCANVEKIGVKPVVGFLSSRASKHNGISDEVDDAIDKFIAKNPERLTVGRIGWAEAKDERLYNARTGLHYPDGRQPNLFILSDLNTGNILYKVLQDPDGTGWQTSAETEHSVVLDKSGRQVVLSKSDETSSKNSEQLATLASNICRDIQDPVVAFLSFSTEGSSKNSEAIRVSKAAIEFRKQNPDVTTYGEIQWDSARDEHIYGVKTGKTYSGGKAPNVFIFPNQDSAEFALSIMRQPLSNGLTAVGPILQGFKDGTLLIDLSRGVDETAGIAVVRLTAKLAGLQPALSGSR